MNKLLLLIVMLSMGATLLIQAQELPSTNTPLTSIQADPPPIVMTATAMLAACVSTLPREPLDLIGTLTVRKQRGIVVSEHPYRLHLDWGATPPFVQCALLDAQGKTQQCLTIIRRDSTPELEFRSGPTLEVQPVPALSARVLDTDMSWLDLTLDFLWWRDVQWEGAGSVLEQTCEILLAKPPAPIPGCSGVRIWLHRENGFLMRAEQLDMDGKPLRRMSVRGVEKFKNLMGREFVNELDVEATKSDFRTRLHVHDVLTP